MDRHAALCFAILIFTSTPFKIIASDEPSKEVMITKYSAFVTELEKLQKDINYTFQRIDLLRRAMTHASFSEENNRALSILGASIIETAVSLRYLLNDTDTSSKVLNRKISEISNVESCAVDGKKLKLHKVIRVSRKTDSTAPAVICGAFRAMFGAIALDIGNSDDAGDVFWYAHLKDPEAAATL